jgi:hypothetical protein
MDDGWIQAWLAELKKRMLGLLKHAGISVKDFANEAQTPYSTTREMPTWGVSGIVDTDNLIEQEWLYADFLG